MRVLLTSAGLETEELKEYFLKMLEREAAEVRALFIPTAATDADAIEVMPKCMHDLLKCGIQNRNIKVFDLHTGMELDELQQYDVVYLCGGSTSYLLERINASGFHKTLMEYIRADGMVIGVSAGSLVFANNLVGNMGLIVTRLEVQCPDGDSRGKIAYPLKDPIRLTNTTALVIREFPNGLEIVGG